MPFKKFLQKMVINQAGLKRRQSLAERRAASAAYTGSLPVSPARLLQASDAPAATCLPAKSGSQTVRSSDSPVLPSEIGSSTSAYLDASSSPNIHLSA